MAWAVGEKKFRIFSKTRQNIPDFRCLTGVSDTGEAEKKYESYEIFLFIELCALGIRFVPLLVFVHNFDLKGTEHRNYETMLV